MMTTATATSGHNQTNLPTMLRSRPPLFAYGIVLFVGAVVAPFLLSLDKISIYSDFGFRRGLSNGSLYSLKNAEQYSNLQASHDIDHSIENRARHNDDPDKCSRIFLYLPDYFADHGHGSQINTYITGVTTATYLNRAMVLAEPPLGTSKYNGGSQFGCPIDAFHETMTKTSSLRGRGEPNWQIRDNFPLGLSRLIEQPAWLSNGCPMPCADTHNYRTWARLYLSFSLSSPGEEFKEITCQNPDGSETNVVATGGARLRQYFRDHQSIMTRNHPSPEAAQWALNLGATPQEAELFSNVKETRKLWDFVLGLMNKAGFFKFQPWIARDTELFLKTFDLPMQEEYSAIHVRRGDKLAFEAAAEVVKYWRKEGHVDPNDLPTNYVPFAHYLSQWDGPDKCLANDEGELQVTKHNVYIATDDPIVVNQEIAALPNHIDQNTVLWNDCHQLTFYFNPSDASAFHLNGDGEEGFEQEEEGAEDNCFMRYHRNIASIADMMILSKARTFIGEYNSNWGRVIRTMRVRLNVPVVQSDDTSSTVVENRVYGVDSLTRTLDSRIAWGPMRERAPGS